MKITYPHIKVFNVENAFNHHAFLEQTRVLTGLLSKTTPPIERKLLLQFLSDIKRKAIVDLCFQIHFLDYLMYQLEQGKTSAKTTNLLFKGFVVVLGLICNPDCPETQERLRNAFQWLKEIDPFYPLMVRVAYTRAPLKLHPNDKIGWNKVLTDCPTIIWNYDCLNSDKQTAQQKDPIVLTESQLKGFEKLQHFSRISGTKRINGISTRPHPLIVGPSGVGKSSLVRHFAESVSLPFLELNSGSWIVSGGKGSSTTLELVADFCRKNSKGILFIDELDKFNGSTDYMHSIMQEVYALIDCRTSGFIGWDQEVSSVLKEGMFIIGGGTWQHLYRRDSKFLGFKQVLSNAPIAERLKEQDSIPDELIFRFNSNVIELKNFTAEEIRDRIVALRKALSLSALESRSLDPLVDQAIHSPLQFRWLEGYLSNILENERPCLDLNDVHGSPMNSLLEFANEGGAR